MIEFKEGREFVGIWFAGSNSQDWMAAVWRDEGEQEWHLDFRFRYYTDARSHDSEDRKLWYKSASSDVEMLKTVCDRISKELPGANTVDFVDMRGLSLDEMVEKLCEQPWAHAKSIAKNGKRAMA